MNNNLNSLIEHENEYWSTIFSKELENKSFQKFSSFWWKDYYNKITTYFDRYIKNNNYSSLLEVGCGSGKASILLKSDVEKILLDISDNALEYAKYIASKFNSEKTSFINGNIFTMPFLNDSFDFVWNIGVVEHYNETDLEKILEEMIRVTRRGGTVAIGVPNFYSGPTLKAYLLSLKFFKFIPGYRLDTEKFYSNPVLCQLFSNALLNIKDQKIIEEFKEEYFGYVLPMETPRVILKTFGAFLGFFLPRNRFLKFLIFKIK